MSVIEQLREAITAYLDSPESESPENRAMTRTATELSRSIPETDGGEDSGPTPGQEAGAAASAEQKKTSDAAKAGPAPRDEETKPKTLAEAHAAATSRMTANKEPVTP